MSEVYPPLIPKFIDSMLQFAGLVLAATTLVTIAIGHVLVRRLQAAYGTRPAIYLFGLGALVLLISLAARPDLLSAVLGITGITIVWDGIEIYRQEKRMKPKPGSR